MEEINEESSYREGNSFNPASLISQKSKMFEESKSEASKSPREDRNQLHLNIPNHANYNKMGNAQDIPYNRFVSNQITKLKDLKEQ